MTLIEVHVNEDPREVEQLVREAYSSIGYREELPKFGLGRVIVWQDRMLQQLELPVKFEDRIFSLWNLPVGRTRVQIGSMQGEVFTSPPENAGEPAARIKEGGRCGREYLVRPFHYSDYGYDD